MPPSYSSLEEDDIRLLVIEPKNNEDPTIRCTLNHVSLKKIKLKKDITPRRNKVSFEGLETFICPEYIHVTSTPREKGLRARGLSRLKATFGGSVKEGEDPLDRPHEYDFSIATDRSPMAAKDPIPEASRLPQSWTSRYEWGDFVALSYCWGDPNDTEEIVIYSGEGEQKKNRRGSRHPVTRNLYIALSHLRERNLFSGALMLWVDALCIDQGNWAERKQQCRRMDKIYQQAGNVLVWLGPDVNYATDSNEANTTSTASKRPITSDHAISYLQWLSAYFRTEIVEKLDHSCDVLQATQWRQVASFHLRQSLQMITSHIRNDFDDIDIDEYGWLSIFHFFDNPYWKRLWIIQELVMSTEQAVVMCGNRFTQWRHIRDSALILAAVSDFVSKKIRDFATTRRLKMPNLADRVIDHVAGIAELGIHTNRKALPFVDSRALSFTFTPGPEGLPRIKGTGLNQLLAITSRANCYRPGDRVLGMLAISPFRLTADLAGLIDKPHTTLQDLYESFALHLILSGTPHNDLGDVKPNEVAVRTEITTLTANGKVTAFYSLSNDAYGGVVANLDLLSLLDGFVDELKLPSWVPNLAIPTWRKTSPFLGPWHASGLGQGVPPPRRKEVHIPETTISTQGLVLKGVFIDNVAGLGAIQSLQRRAMVIKLPRENELVLPADPIPCDVELPDGFQSIYLGPTLERGVVQAEIPLDLSYPLEGDIETALYQVLTGNTDMHGNLINAKCLLTEIPKRNWRTPEEKWNWDFINSSLYLRIGEKTLGEYFGFSSNAAPQYDMFNANYDFDGVHAAMSSMASKTKGRRLLLTSRRGFIGLGPISMRAGDSIAILVGHNRPVVIRMAFIQDGQPIWRIIGECFVQGLMEGEAAKFGMIAQMHDIILL